MKNTSYLLYKLLITTIVLTLFIVSCEKKPIIAKIEYAESIKPITIKDKALPSFRVNYEKDLNRESILKMARQLSETSGKPLNFKNLTDMKNGSMIIRTEKDPSALFKMDTRSGSFIYNSGLAEYKKEASTPSLITGDKAKSIALEHLKKLGLLPNNKKELNLVHTGGLNMAVIKEGEGDTKIYNKLVTIRYNRILSGLPVMGASRIIVNMGTNGKLVGLIYDWGEVDEGRKIEPEKLLSDKEIKSTLEDRLKEGAKGTKRIIVEKADLVLYDDGGGYIEPAYYIQTRLFYENPQEKEGEILKYDVPYDYYIPVLKKPMAIYPYMEKAEIQPADKRGVEIAPESDE